MATAAEDATTVGDTVLHEVRDSVARITLNRPDAANALAPEQRDRLKLPDNVGAMKVENGELVMQQK